MGVGDDKVGEMGGLLDRAQRLDRALEATEEIHERAHDQELRRKIPAEAVPLAHHRSKEVYEHGPHWNDQHHGRDDRDGLGPIGDRTVEIMMDANEWIEQRERPEADER